MTTEGTWELSNLKLPHAHDSSPQHRASMSSSTAQYKDRQFLAVIGDEVRIPHSFLILANRPSGHRHRHASCRRRRTFTSLQAYTSRNLTRDTARDATTRRPKELPSRRRKDGERGNREGFRQLHAGAQRHRHPPYQPAHCREDKTSCGSVHRGVSFAAGDSEQGPPVRS
jgi:hypothetical protein